MNSELTKKGNQLTLTRCIFNHIFDISLSYLIFNIIFILFILLVILMTSPENSCVFRGDSGYDDSKNISAKTSNPNTTRTISSEAYDFCGEPLIAQHLTLDFTPVQGLDSDAVARKVCSFWEFIHGTPSIQDLKMKPEPEEVKLLTKKSTCVHMKAVDLHSDSESTDSRHHKKAIEFIKFSNQRGMLDGTRLPKSMSHYTVGSDYFLGERETKEDKKAHVCTCSSKKSTCCTYPKKTKAGPTKTIKDWESKHPKSMKPPGHAPSLQHAILQRPVPN